MPISLDIPRRLGYIEVMEDEDMRDIRLGVMRKYTVAVVEVGPDYTDQIDTLPEVDSMAAAVKATSGAGYRVMSDAAGGCSELCETTDGAYYIVSVWPGRRA